MARRKKKRKRKKNGKIKSTCRQQDASLALPIPLCRQATSMIVSNIRYIHKQHGLLFTQYSTIGISSNNSRLLRDGRLASLPSTYPNLDRRCFLKAPPSTPIVRLSLQEGSDGTQISFVAQKIRLRSTFTPEFDGIAECVHGLRVTSNEGATKINVG